MFSFNIFMYMKNAIFIYNAIYMFISVSGGLPGKQVVRCSISASCVTGLRAEFMAEMARHRISPSGMN